MAATRENEVVLAEADDDDGMPPLVDNPNPIMTFTFATDMTPITFSNGLTGYEPPPDDGPPEMSIYSPPESPAFGPVRVSHAKKRDPSYIPRPPNAFILFRSSFIRAEHIPGKIEGNHSALSKIIGKCWKALPREQREVWEAKALVAQAEHRKKYPDWRFRPSANALAKVKDGPKRRSRKGRGEAEKEVRSREKRCAKIADFIVAGKTGPALEAAVKEYDCETKGEVKAGRTCDDETVVAASAAAVTEPKEEAKDSGLAAEVAQVKEAPRACTDDRPGRAGGTGTRSKTPDAAYDSRFKVPLTAMFKRSSSAPASHSRNSNGQFDALGRPVVAEGLTVPATPPTSYASPLLSNIASPPLRHEVIPRVGTVTYLLNDGMSKALSSGVAAMQQPLQSFYSAEEYNMLGNSPNWHAASAASPVLSECWSPPLPAFTPDLDGAMSPVQPSSPASFNYSSPQVGNHLFDIPMFSRFDGVQIPLEHESFHSSYSSLHGWAGDAFGKGDQPLSHTAPSYIPPSAGAGGFMKDAFGVAAGVDWRSLVGASMAQDLAFAPPNNTRDLEGGQFYSENSQSFGCLPGNTPFVF